MRRAEVWFRSAERARRRRWSTAWRAEWFGPREVAWARSRETR